MGPPSLALFRQSQPFSQSETKRRKTSTKKFGTNIMMPERGVLHTVADSIYEFNLSVKRITTAFDNNQSRRHQNGFIDHDNCLFLCLFIVFFSFSFVCLEIGSNTIITFMLLCTRNKKRKKKGSCRILLKF